MVAAKTSCCRVSTELQPQRPAKVVRGADADGPHDRPGWLHQNLAATGLTDQSSWSDPTSGTSGGGEGYFWNDFDKNSQYGSDGQLKQAVAALTNAGVQAVYDVVPNHMNDKLAGKQVRFQAPRRGEMTAQPLSDRDQGDAFMSGSADLNTGNVEVSSRFMQEFRNLARQLWRQRLALRFCAATRRNVDIWMKNFGDQAFCVGELWKSPTNIPPRTGAARLVGKMPSRTGQTAPTARCSISPSRNACKTATWPNGVTA
jgi:hypothetical protein